MTSIVQIHEKKQGEIPGSLHKAKFQNFGVDKSHFHVIGHHGVKEESNTRVYSQEKWKGNTGCGDCPDNRWSSLTTMVVMSQMINWRIEHLSTT